MAKQDSARLFSTGPVAVDGEQFAKIRPYFLSFRFSENERTNEKKLIAFYRNKINKAI